MLIIAGVGSSHQHTSEFEPCTLYHTLREFNSANDQNAQNAVSQLLNRVLGRDQPLHKLVIMLLALAEGILYYINETMDGELIS